MFSHGCEVPKPICVSQTLRSTKTNAIFLAKRVPGAGGLAHARHDICGSKTG